MRAEFNLERRAVVSELLRRRARDLRSMASDRTMSSLRQEIEAEAELHEQWADDLMDFADAAEKVVTANTITNSNADIDHLTK